MKYKLVTKQKKYKHGAWYRDGELLHMDLSKAVPFPTPDNIEKFVPKGLVVEKVTSYSSYTYESGLKTVQSCDVQVKIKGWLQYEEVEPVNAAFDRNLNRLLDEDEKTDD